MTTRQVTGTIKAAYPRDGARGPYFEVEILRDGMQYPDKYQAFDDDATACGYLRDHIGERWTLDVERGNAKKDEPDPKRYGDWHWNLKGAVPGGSSGSQTASGQPEGDNGDYRRSKEEMRWTEALGLAVQLHGTTEGATPDFDILESWAAALYDLIAAGPPQAGVSHPINPVTDHTAHDAPLPFEDDDTEPDDFLEGNGVFQPKPQPAGAQQPATTGTKLRDCPDHKKPLLKVPAQAGGGLGHPIKDSQGQIERWCRGERDGQPVGEARR